MACFSAQIKKPTMATGFCKQCNKPLDLQSEPMYDDGGGDCAMTIDHYRYTLVCTECQLGTPAFSEPDMAIQCAIFRKTDPEIEQPTISDEANASEQSDETSAALEAFVGSNPRLRNLMTLETAHEFNIPDLSDEFEEVLHAYIQEKNYDSDDL